MTWTGPAIESLKTLWAEGRSASEIAARLAGVSRNAVIGKVHRLGLPGRGQRATRPKSLRRGADRAPRSKRIAPVRANTHAVPPLGPPPAATVTVATIRSGLCRWPEGDPNRPDFHFCGRAAGEGPYCPHHAARAYQPAPKRSRERLARDGPAAASALSP